jgi:hypothetical protein
VQNWAVIVENRGTCPAVAGGNPVAVMTYGVASEASQLSSPDRARGKQDRSTWNNTCIATDAYVPRGT